METTQSTRVTSSNLIDPVSIPKAEIRYISETIEDSTGIRAYTRRVPQESTVLSEEDGKFIIPPGKAIGFYLHNTTASGICRVALGWYEEPI